MQTTRGPQRALAKQIDEGQCNARAEGIARLYLGGRKSVLLHNHFPIVLQIPPQLSSAYTEAAAALIESLTTITLENSLFSKTIRAARRPAKYCDFLEHPDTADHFAILHCGRVFSIALSVAADRHSTRNMLATIVTNSIEIEHLSGPRLGDYSALPGSTWFKAHKSLLTPASTSRGAVAALETLRTAAFLVCLDSNSHPENITDIGRALRFQNLGNRFFDKCLQFIVCGNGQCGFLCDHAVIDGVEAMKLAAKVHAGMLHSNVIDSAEVPPRPINTKPAFQEHSYDLPPRLMSNQLAMTQRQISKVCSISVALTTFNTNYFKDKSCSADTLIQFAIQLAFVRSMGFLPSVLEPVSLSHLPAGRLDFISPVSELSKQLIQSIMSRESEQTQLERLKQAASQHRKAIRSAKKGLGHIGHLLALTTLEFPSNQRLGATWLRLKESFFGKIDPGSSLLTQRDVVASNGGYNPAVKLFGTMTHRTDLIGIGYMVGPHGLTIDIQANGKYAKHGEAFASEFASALKEITEIDKCYFLKENRSDAI
jgi:Choline/Carnitine o-acyltransferase